MTDCAYATTAWIVFALFAAMPHCWLVHSLLCTRKPKGFSEEPELLSQEVPSLYHYKGFFIFECRTSDILVGYHQVPVGSFLQSVCNLLDLLLRCHPSLPSLVSPTNFMSKHSVTWSLIETLNKTCPGKDPCGNPFVNGFQVQYDPLTATLWVQTFRQIFTYIIMCPSRPQWLTSDTTPWETVSKAFLKSTVFPYSQNQSFYYGRQSGWWGMIGR